MQKLGRALVFRSESTRYQFGYLKVLQLFGGDVMGKVSFPLGSGCGFGPNKTVYYINLREIKQVYGFIHLLLL